MRYVLPILLLIPFLVFSGCFKKHTPVKVVKETLPEYPGGEKALSKFLRKEIKYPEKAIEENTQGTVYVKFLVKKDGSVANVEIIEGVSPELDAEAIRVVKKMPNWIPGTQDGEPVVVSISLPITFKLQ